MRFIFPFIFEMEVLTFEAAFFLCISETTVRVLRLLTIFSNRMISHLGTLVSKSHRDGPGVWSKDRRTPQDKARGQQRGWDETDGERERRMEGEGRTNIEGNVLSFSLYLSFSLIISHSLSHSLSL